MPQSLQSTSRYQLSTVTTIQHHPRIRVVTAVFQCLNWASKAAKICKASKARHTAASQRNKKTSIESLSGETLSKNIHSKPSAVGHGKIQSPCSRRSSAISVGSKNKPSSSARCWTISPWASMETWKCMKIPSGVTWNTTLTWPNTRLLKWHA